MISFLRRIPPALHWRAMKLWSIITRSQARREIAGHSVWAARRLKNRSGKRSRGVRLRFANALGQPLPEHRWFAEEVAALSGGDMRIEFYNHWTTTANRREETSTIAGASHAQADLSWAGTRAFGPLGVRSLDPLQAPLLFSSYDAIDSVLRAGFMSDMLDPLQLIGLIGLAVLPGALRKPFAFTRRLIDPRDYEGARLRIHESVVAEKTYNALGAQAVLLSPDEMGDRPETKVDGMDLQTAAIVSWGVSGSVTFNVNLWPRTLALVASRKTYQWLGTDEQQLLMRAAENTRDRALTAFAGQAERDLSELPHNVGIVTASDEQLARLREQVEPVYEDLRSHAETRDGLEKVEAIVSRYQSAAGPPAGGPRSGVRAGLGPAEAP
jgi:TRAP-type C4-dicarboxylate transport system substrate-binding protein